MKARGSLSLPGERVDRFSIRPSRMVVATLAAVAWLLVQSTVLPLLGWSMLPLDPILPLVTAFALGKATLDAWLLAREADGSLATIRRAELRQDGPLSAEPLRALAAALDERLSLMPWVALAKQRLGVPVEVPERETRVLEAAVAAVEASARRAGRNAPPREAIAGFFRAQFEAAKQVQEETLAESGPHAREAVPDLETQLRPALLRIGERMARLIVALPTAGLDSATVRAVLAAEIRIPELQPLSREKLTVALVELVDAMRVQRTSSRVSNPASTGKPRQTP